MASDPSWIMFGALGTLDPVDGPPSGSASRTVYAAATGLPLPNIILTPGAEQIHSCGAVRNAFISSNAAISATVPALRAELFLPTSISADFSAPARPIASRISSAARRASSAPPRGRRGRWRSPLPWLDCRAANTRGDGRSDDARHNDARLIAVQFGHSGPVPGNQVWFSPHPAQRSTHTGS